MRSPDFFDRLAQRVLRRALFCEQPTRAAGRLAGQRKEKMLAGDVKVVHRACGGVRVVQDPPELPAGRGGRTRLGGQSGETSAELSVETRDVNARLRQNGTHDTTLLGEQRLQEVEILYGGVAGRPRPGGRVLKRLRRPHRQSVSRYHAFAWLLYHQWM